MELNQETERLLHITAEMLNVIGGDFNVEKLKHESFANIVNSLLVNGVKIKLELVKPIQEFEVIKKTNSSDDLTNDYSTEQLKQMWEMAYPKEIDNGGEVVITETSEFPIAEFEIKQLKSTVSNFKYTFTQHDYMNYLTLCIEKDGYDIKTILSKLKPNEIIIFSLNPRKTFNGSNDQIEGSIYWKHPVHGMCVRVKSSDNSLQNWSDEITKIFSSEYVDIELPPYEDLDENGKYIGDDYKFK